MIIVMKYRVTTSEAGLKSSCVSVIQTTASQHTLIMAEEHDVKQETEEQLQLSVCVATQKSSLHQKGIPERSQIKEEAEEQRIKPVEDPPIV
ncbi:unnamed protein product [Knipowitschia caucasica]